MRKVKTKRDLMVLVGNLTDHWEQMPSDLKGEINEAVPLFYKAVEELWQAVEPVGEGD